MKASAVVLAAGVAALLWSASQGGENPMSHIKGSRVLMVVASRDFRDEEFAEPYDRLMAAGAVVTVVSSTGAPTRGMLGRVLQPDGVLREQQAASYDAVIFVGGSGAQEYFNNPDAHRLAREAAEANRIVAAMCIAPAILANAGVLRGRRATCFPSVLPLLRKGGAVVTDRPVVRDGILITAPGPEAAREFALAIQAALEERTDVSGPSSSPSP